MSNTLTPHDYIFDKQCHVDLQALDSDTIESRERTNAAYLKDRGAYLRSTYAALRQTIDCQPLALFCGADDSPTDLLLAFNPFGTPIAPDHSVEDMVDYVNDRGAKKTPKNIEPNDINKLLQARFLYDTLDVAGITDDEGRRLPVAYFSAPSMDHTSPITAKERRKIARGDLSPMAARPLEYVRNLGFNRLYVAGYSLGAIAAGAVRLAGDRDMEVLAGCFVGDAPNFKNRYPRRPLPFGAMVPYMADSLFYGYEGDWINDAPEPRRDIARNGESYDALGHWFTNGNFKVNLAIGQALSRKKLPETLVYMSDNHIPTAISWSESRLMKGFEEFINNEPSAEQLAMDGLLALYCARRAPHLSGENPLFLTDVMLRSVKFARASTRQPQA
jgi:hypothetical protein